MSMTAGNLACFRGNFPLFPYTQHGRKLTNGHVKFPSFPCFSLCYFAFFCKSLFCIGCSLCLPTRKFGNGNTTPKGVMSLPFPFPLLRSQPLTYTRKSPVLCALKRARTKPLYRTAIESAISVPYAERHTRNDPSQMYGTHTMKYKANYKYQLCEPFEYVLPFSVDELYLVPGRWVTLVGSILRFRAGALLDGREWREFPDTDLHGPTRTKTDG